MIYSRIYNVSFYIYEMIYAVSVYMAGCMPVSVEIGDLLCFRTISRI
jgi:hypothetical protein